MTTENRKKLLKEREFLMNELLQSPTWIDGSIIETERIQSGKKKPFFYLSRSKSGSNKIVYISKKQLSDFKEAKKQGIRVKEILNQIIEINIKLIKMR